MDLQILGKQSDVNYKIRMIVALYGFFSEDHLINSPKTNDIMRLLEYYVRRLRKYEAED